MLQLIDHRCYVKPVLYTHTYKLFRQDQVMNIFAYASANFIVYPYPLAPRACIPTLAYISM